MQKTIHKVKAIIFDMDGVITNTMPDHHRAWKDVLQKYGVNISHLDVYAREGQPGNEALVEIFEKYDIDYDYRDIEKILKQKESHFKKNVKIRFIPNTRTLLKSLFKNNFKLGLVTGTARHELKRILPNHLSQLFSVIVTGNDVNYGKPHPEPFLKALSRLNVQAHEAIVIENAPYGIQSAKSAGIRCLALETSLSREFLVDADHIFPSVRDLKDHITFEYKI